jgi:tRNA pseudouridine55 synthase
VNPEGILVVDKPAGVTSHDVVHRIRKCLGIRRVGHAGTLDPMATGVLVVAIGAGTKLLQFLAADDKEYLAEVTLGFETTSFDAEGTVTSETSIAPEWRRDVASHVASVLDAECARIEQVPPAVSAIHVEGQRAHDRARRGEQFEIPARNVVVHRIEMTRLEGVDEPRPRLTFSLHVGKGYYVRAFARDLGRRLGTLGTLTALRRTRSGAFSLADACVLAADRMVLASRVLPVEVVARRVMPVLELDPEAANHAACGRPFQATTPSAVPRAWCDGEGRLIAIGLTDADGFERVARGFSRG